MFVQYPHVYMTSRNIPSPVYFNGDTFVKISIVKMECVIKQFAVESTIVLAHFLLYGNGSIFVWVSSPDIPEISDFHAAVPDKYSYIPAVTTKVGEMESTGRLLALKLAKKLQVPVIVSWNIEVYSPEIVSSIEHRLFEEIKSAKTRTVTHSPVVGA